MTVTSQCWAICERAISGNRTPDFPATIQCEWWYGRYVSITYTRICPNESIDPAAITMNSLSSLQKPFVKDTRVVRGYHFHVVNGQLLLSKRLTTKNNGRMHIQHKLKRSYFITTLMGIFFSRLPWMFKGWRLKVGGKKMYLASCNTCDINVQYPNIIQQSL
jgi:hypothetical protein